MDFSIEFSRAELGERIRRVVLRTKQMDFAWDWPAGVALYGVARAYESTGEAEYLEYLKQWVDQHLKCGLPPLTVNAVSVGHAVLTLYQHTKEEIYLETVQRMASFLTNEAVRFGDGVLQHTVSQNFQFPGQAWADTLFMAGLFLVRAGRLLEDGVMTRDGLKQFYWHVRYLQDEKTGLFYHAYDSQTQSNLSGVYWARANGWCAVTLSALMEMSDPFEPMFVELADALRDQLAALIRLQREDGMWSTVLDDDSAYTETSAACAIATALVQYGFDGYREHARRAAEAIIGQIDQDGVVCGVSAGTAVMHTAEDYKQIPNHRIQGWGQGLALTLLAVLYEHCEEA